MLHRSSSDRFLWSSRSASRSRPTSLNLSSSSSSSVVQNTNSGASESLSLQTPPRPSPTGFVRQADREESSNGLVFQDDKALPPLPTLTSLSREENIKETSSSKTDTPIDSPTPPQDTDTNADKPTQQNDADCPICLNNMKAADLSHPLQCSNACGFNFCRPCIESLIVSSKDDYKESSDGAMHVKIHLQCPNCRSDLSSTIRDTVLLRKAAHIKTCCSEGCDELLTASELRMQIIMDCTEVKKAIAGAKKREAKFFGKLRDVESSPATAFTSMNTSIHSITSLNTTIHTITSVPSYDECGIEADLDHGILVTHKRKNGRSRRKSKNRSSIYGLIDEAKKVRDKKANKKENTPVTASTTSTRDVFSGNAHQPRSRSRHYGRGRMTWWY